MTTKARLNGKVVSIRPTWTLAYAASGTKARHNGKSSALRPVWTSAYAPTGTRAKPNGKSGSALGEPVWEVARLFPVQGEWTEEDYFSLPDNTRVELVEGRLEWLPMPTTSHQRILAFIYGLLLAFVNRHYPGAEVLFASLPIRLGPKTLREPDIVLMLPEHRNRIQEQYWEQPDLVMEIVSAKNRAADIRDKRREYAQAGIPEYWIVDPQAKTVTVLTLADKSYRVHGEYRSGETAESVLLSGFRVDVDDIWRAAGSALPTARPPRRRGEKI
jgi:Uma2 family endonuclease